MSTKKDVIVIGGGVIGSSIAYYLSKAGKKVLLTERKDHASGASGSCDQAIIMQTKKPGIHLKMALASAEMYETLGEELDYDIPYKRDGGMIIIETPEEMKVMESFVDKQKKIGLQVEILNRKEAAKRQKGLAKHILGSTYSPQDAHVDPLKLNFGYAYAAVKLGAEILLETEVTGINLEGNTVKGVETNRGSFSAPLVINATGPWAPNIGKMIGLEIPIKPRRGQIVITEPVPPFINGDINSASYIVAKYFPERLLGRKDKASQLGVGLALGQTEKGNILIGATRELVGYDSGTTKDGIREILKNAARVIPKLKDINVIRVMSGLRPYTPDGLPLVGKVQGFDGFFMAAGHEGDGIALAPVTGRIVADLITTGKTFMDVSALSPNRFNK
ncbi:MAG: FAD-binding oxidoreductase [bacterium]|nr:FAD-binding oxidoreductase [bacterium]